MDILELLNEDSEKIIHWIDYALTTSKKDKITRGKLVFSLFFKSLSESFGLEY